MTTSAYLSGRKKYSRPQAVMWADSAPTIAASSIYAGISTTANITAGQNTMTISTGNAALLKVGYAITRSSGTGAFGLTTPIITAINTGTGQITLSVNHATPGTMTFYAGLPIYLPSGEEVGASASGDNFLILSDHNRKELSFKNTRIEKRERMINGRMRSYHIADKISLSVSWDMLPSRSFSTDPLFNSSGVSAFSQQSPNLTDTAYTVDGGAGGVDIVKWYEDHKDPFYVYLQYDRYDNFATIASVDSAAEYDRIKEYNEVILMYVSDFSYSVQKRGGSNYDFWNISCSLEEV